MQCDYLNSKAEKRDRWVAFEIIFMYSRHYCVLTDFFLSKNLHTKNNTYTHSWLGALLKYTRRLLCIRK